MNIRERQNVVNDSPSLQLAAAFPLSLPPFLSLLCSTHLTIYKTEKEFTELTVYVSI